MQKARAVSETLGQTRQELRKAVDREDAASQRAEGFRIEAKAHEAQAQAHEAYAQSERQAADRARADLETAKASVLAALQRETFTRTDLTAALQASLTARAGDQARARQRAAFAWTARAARPLRRRTRLVRLAERLLARTGEAGHRRIVQAAGFHQTPALFDADWYLAHNADVAARGADPLVHYLTTGAFEGRSPHPLFDETAYRARHAHALAATGLSGLEHYVSTACNALVSPHPLFDPVWYVAQADVPPGEDPFSHYQREGWRLGHEPHPLFDTAWYMAQAGDPPPGASPLSHYVSEGWRAGLSPHPLIDPAWYRQTHGDLVPADADPLLDFLENPDRSPGPLFDAQAYAKGRPEPLPPGANPLADYLTGGAWTIYAVDARTTTAAYIAARPQSVAQGLTPLDHWARQPAPI